MTAVNTQRDSYRTRTVRTSALRPVMAFPGRTAVTGRFMFRTEPGKSDDTPLNFLRQLSRTRFEGTFALTEMPGTAHTLYQQANAHLTDAEPARRGPLDTSSVLHRTQHRAGAITEGP